MRTPVKQLAAATASVALALLVGCDDARSSDKDVRAKLNEAFGERAKGDDARQAALKLEEEAVAIATASPEGKAQAREALARSFHDEAARLAGQVTDNQRRMSRLIYEIGQLGNQIQAGNTKAAGYRLAEPVEARKIVAARVTEAQGGADKPIWFPAENAHLPTLAAVTQRISQLEGEIAKRQQQVKQLGEQRNAIASQAEQLAQQSEQLKGQQSVDVFKQASAARKKAADLSTQMEVIEAEIVPLQRDLAVAQVQAKAANEAVAVFQKQLLAIEQGWKNIQQQVEQQAGIAASIVGAGAAPPAQQTNVEGGEAAAGGAGGGGDQAAAIASAKTMSEKAAMLAKLADENRALFGEAEQALNNAIKHFEDAATSAQDLAREVGQRTGQLERSNPTRVAYESLLNVIHPSGYRLGAADANQALATLHASRVISLADRQRLRAALEPVLAAAGLELPKALQDAQVETELKTSVETANEKFKTAGDLYLGVSTEAPSDALKQAGYVGRIFSQYGQLLVARATGDDAAAKTLLAEAEAARKLAEENKAMLPALPVELVQLPAEPKPTTGPATRGATTGPAAPTPRGGGRAAPPAPAPTPAAPAPPPAAPAPAPDAPPAPAPPAAPAAPQARAE